MLQPFLNGDDLNSTVDGLGTRWAINFRDWPEARARLNSAVFAACEARVKPEVLRKGPTYGGWAERWWQHWRPRAELYSRLETADVAMAITIVSNVVQWRFVPASQVFSHAVAALPAAAVARLGLLCSALHGEWVRKHASSMRTDIRYTPSDVFETFPFPSDMVSLDAPGEAMETARNAVMQGRWIGLTKTYNLVNDPSCTDADVQALRDAHVALDKAVLAAYGWDDLDPRHGFYDTAQGRRFTIHPEVRDEVLDRLLELNHARYAEEVAAGLHAKGARKKATKKPAPKPAPPDAQLTIL